MSTITIPLTRAQFTNSSQKLQDTANIKIAGDQGTVEGFKVRVGYFYNGIDTLTLNIDHKPWYYPEAEVESEIRKWFMP